MTSASAFKFFEDNKHLFETLSCNLVHNAEDIDNFLPLPEERQAAGGTILVSQGDTDRDLYLLLNGSYSAFYKIRVNLTAVATNVGNWPGPSLLGEVNLVLDNTRKNNLFKTNLKNIIQ